MKKTKKYFIYSTIIVLFTALFFSCKADIENAVASITGSAVNDVQEAQTWYNKNRLETFSIGLVRVKSSKNKFSAKPDWKHAYGVKYDGYTAVHTPLNTMGKFSFVTPENKQAYEATADKRYLKTFTQMVVINEKKDKRTYAFLMTLVPDKAYLESTHFAAFNSNYRKWQKGYSGYVYYHTVDGRFNNGWKFINGKVVKRVTQENENGIDISLDARKKVTSTTVCNTYQQEIWSQNCYSWGSSYEYQGTQYYNYGSDCGSWYFDGYQYFTECYDDGTGGGGYGGSSSGGSGGGGSGSGSGSGTGTNNGGYTGPAVGTRTDCASVSSGNTSLVESALMYNSTTYATSAVASYVSTLRGYAGSQSVEYGFSINYDNGNYWMYSDNGSIFCSGTQTQVSILFSNSAFLQGHTHVQGDLTTPSPKDFISLCNLNLQGATNIHGNIIFAYDGSESLVYVDDPAKFQAFCASIANNASLFNYNTDAHFLPGSVYANTYDAVYNQLKNTQNYSESIANSYALTYVLDHYDTGVKISSRSNSTDQFKQQYTNDNNYNYFLPFICP